MSIKTYLKQLKNIQENIVEYINNGDGTEVDSLNIAFLKDQKFDTNKYLLKETLYMLLSIANNHHHTKNFYNKIFTILNLLKESIKINLTNYDVFSIFKSNKRMILFLIESKIIVLDESMTNILSECKFFTYNYPEYFYSEIGSKRLDKLPFYDIIGENYWPLSVPNFPVIEFSTFYDTLFKDHECDIINGDGYDKNTSFKEPKTSDDKKQFEKNRRIGENDDYLAYSIQNDLIDNFKSHISVKNIKLTGTIRPSIYETNRFLFNKNPTLIQYAMFWGSTKIIKYLCEHKVKLDSSLWLYAIHSKNPEILQFLKDNKVETTRELDFKCYLESIKCHHNIIAFYIKDQILKNITKEEEQMATTYILKYHNYFHFNENFLTNTNLFYELCKYDYYLIVDSMLQSSSNLDINKVRQYKKVANFDFKRSNTPLTAAVSNNNYEIVELLLSQKTIDVNSNWMQELNEKVDNRHYKSVKTALIIAVEKENKNMVDLLLSHPKIDVNFEMQLNHHFFSYTFQESKTPISISIIKKNFEIFKLLLDHPKINVNQKISFGCDLSETNKNHRKESPLILTIDFQLQEYFQLLLQHKDIDVNTISEYKELGKNDIENSKNEYCEFTAISALNLAIKWNNTKMIKSLLENPNINVNLISNPKLLEETPLLASFKKGNWEAFDILLKHPKINVNVEMTGDFKYGKTILQFAFEKWDDYIIKKLLSKKEINANLVLIEKFNSESFPDHLKDVKSRGNEESLLQVAVEKENYEIIKLLLQRKEIDTNFLNSKVVIDRQVHKKTYEEVDHIEIQKKTALVIACEKNNTEIVRLLLSDPNIDINKKSTVNKIERKYESKLGENGGGWILKHESKKVITESALSVAKENGNQKIIALLES